MITPPNRPTHGGSYIQQPDGTLLLVPPYDDQYSNAVANPVPPGMAAIASDPAPATAPDQSTDYPQE